MGKKIRASDFKKRKLEQRAYTFEISATADETTGHMLEGRAIVYGQPADIYGCFSETIRAGALDGTDMTDVRFLVNHDQNKVPLARSRNNTENSTMQLLVDEQGLSIRVNLDTENNADAAALYSAVERGDISGMSFLALVAKDTWEDVDTDYPKRYIDSFAAIYEVSAVTFPAYEGTDLAARDKQLALESARQTLESAEKRSLENGEELELWKAKNRILGGN